MNEFTNLCEEIKQTVQDAVDTMDFDQLNKNITNSVNSAFYEVRNRLNLDPTMQKKEHQTVRDWKVTNGTSQEQQSQVQREQKKREAMERAKQMKRNTLRREPTNVGVLRGKYVGPILITIGALFATITGIASFVLLVLLRTINVFGIRIALQIVGAFFFANLAMVYCGKRIRKRLTRFHKYTEYIGERKYCPIEALSKHTGYSVKYVSRDIQKMARLGMFRHIHWDHEHTCLIFDDETYELYLQTVTAYEEKQKEVKQKTKKLEESQDTELRKVIVEGNRYIQQLQDINAAIFDVEMSNKLSRLELITRNIFEFVEQHPEQLSELRRFMEYYLPISLKLVNAYKQLDAQPVQGENITKSKQEILLTLDTINDAFDVLFDGLHQKTAMDVSSDITVLETLFAQDGLTKNEFDMNDGGGQSNGT